MKRRIIGAIISVSALVVVLLGVPLVAELRVLDTIDQMLALARGSPTPARTRCCRNSYGDVARLVLIRRNVEPSKSG